MPTSKIMVIRHAEKPTSTADGVDDAGKKNDEELIVRGWQRSGALVRLFAPRDGKFVDPRLVQPKSIFAAGIGHHSNSLRPQHTVLALSQFLNLKLDLHYPKGDELDVVKAALDVDGPVLIAWQHEDIPDIGNDITGDNTTCPQEWPDDRFDLVWVFDRKTTGDGWDFSQVPQLLLPGDSDKPIK